MDRNDQQAIEQLFGKLADVERQAQPRDGQSDAFIRDRIASQPGAPYYMAQTVIVQEQALMAAQARIEELEAQASQAPRQSGGLFGGLFGGGQQQPARGSVPRTGLQRNGGASGAWGGASAAPQQGQAFGQQQRGGGGFLAGAAQTAMGVAGGVLLANAIGGMFGADEAQAAEAPQEPVEEPVDEAGFDDGGGMDDMEF